MNEQELLNNLEGMTMQDLLNKLDELDLPECPDFTDEEWAALDEDIPMSPELYISCIEKCLEGDYTLKYVDIIDQFPEYTPVLDAYFEKKHGIKPTTPEESEAALRKFKERLLRERGVNLFTSEESHD